MNKSKLINKLIFLSSHPVNLLNFIFPFDNLIILRAAKLDNWQPSECPTTCNEGISSPFLTIIRIESATTLLSWTF